MRTAKAPPPWVTFQFTQESRAGDKYEYTLETMLALEKATGKVKCERPGLATLAQELVDAAIDARTGTDITRCVKRLFDRHADLFPVREKGSVYFVPQAHADFVAQVQAFLGRVNGRLARFPVPEGTPQGDRSVKDAVAGGIAAMIADHRAAVDGFGADTRKDTLERAAERSSRSATSCPATRSTWPTSGSGSNASWPPQPPSCVPRSSGSPAHPSRPRPPAEPIPTFHPETAHDPHDAGGPPGAGPEPVVPGDPAAVAGLAVPPRRPPTPAGEEECGLMIDRLGLCGQTGYSATVVLANLFDLPPTLPEFLALPRHAYDTADEVFDAGWRVD